MISVVKSIVSKEIKTSKDIRTSKDVQIKEKGKIDWRKVKQKAWADRFMYAMIAPVVVYFFIFRYIPMAWLRVAFYEFRILRGFQGSEFVGFDNFRLFLNNPAFLQILWNTIWLNILNIMFVFTAPILFAILLNEIARGKFKKIIQTISYLPHFLSTVVVVSMITTFLSPSVGFLNRVIRDLGGSAIHFLGDPQYFRPIMISSSIWQGIGWGSIVYLSALTSIDQEQYEAAIIDGASRLKQIWHITLPGIRNTIIVLLILQVGSLLSVGFERVWLLQNPQNLRVSEVLSTYIFRMGLQNFNFGLGSAAGLFNGVIGFVLVLFANKLSKKYSETSLM